MVGTVSSKAVGTDVISTISGLTICAYVIGAVSGKAICTDVVSAISSLTVVAYAVSAIGSQTVGTDVIRTIGSLTIRTGVGSVGVGRTPFRYNSTGQYVVVIGNRQSEYARCQDGKTKTKNKI